LYVTYRIIEHSEWHCQQSKYRTNCSRCAASETHYDTDVTLSISCEFDWIRDRSAVVSEAGRRLTTGRCLFHQLRLLKFYSSVHFFGVCPRAKRSLRQVIECCADGQWVAGRQHRLKYYCRLEHRNKLL